MNGATLRANGLLLQIWPLHKSLGCDARNRTAAPSRAGVVSDARLLTPTRIVRWIHEGRSGRTDRRAFGDHRLISRFSEVIHPSGFGVMAAGR